MTFQRTIFFGLSLAVLLLARCVWGLDDWPQWRGQNGAAKATDFVVPQAWPKELTQKWKVSVGDGVATPVLVGTHLFVFTRQDNDEIVRCLDVSDGKEIWSQKRPASRVNGPDSSFSGPRSSPAVASGKVITIGVDGVITCYDAEKGTELWRKTDFSGEVPRFHASSSPIILGATVSLNLETTNPAGSSR